MTNRSYTKWTKVVEMLQAHPGVWHTVAQDAGPSAIQRLKALGAEVRGDTLAPRTDGVTYSRYLVEARWPTPTTQREEIQLKHDQLKIQLAELKADVDAADEEYASAKRSLNRNAYRRKQARARYEPVLEQVEYLNSTLRLMDKKKAKG